MANKASSPQERSLIKFMAARVCKQSARRQDGKSFVRVLIFHLSIHYLLARSQKKWLSFLMKKLIYAILGLSLLAMPTAVRATPPVFQYFTNEFDTNTLTITNYSGTGTVVVP